MSMGPPEPWEMFFPAVGRQLGDTGELVLTHTGGRENRLWTGVWERGWLTRQWSQGQSTSLGWAEVCHDMDVWVLPENTSGPNGKELEGVSWALCPVGRPGGARWLQQRVWWRCPGSYLLRPSWIESYMPGGRELQKRGPDRKDVRRPSKCHKRGTFILII